MNPTAEQQAILDLALTDDNIMVEALAGTGKTSLLAMLVPRLQSSRILAVAFNVKIRDELQARLSHPNLQVKTLNGLGFQAWNNFTRKHPEVAGNKTYKLIREYEAQHRVRFTKEETQDLTSLVAAAKVLGFVPKGLPLPGKPLLPDTPSAIEEIFEWAEVDQRDDLAVAFRGIMVTSCTEGLLGKRIDFNDQIYLPIVFQASFPQYDTLLVDEAQDLSHMNQLMLEACKPRRIIAVGDRNQAIYAFRGALSNSMDALEVHRPYVHRPLTVTFRCGQAIVERARDFVPSYQAASTNPEGEILEWTTWGEADIPQHAAVICRNNAPLISLAFTLLRHKRGVNMLGRDIGVALESSLNKATKRLPANSPRAMVHAAVTEYFAKEKAKAKTPARQDRLADREACLLTIVNEAATLEQAKVFCHRLFENEDATVILSSGHKSKGLEFDTVIHLNPDLIPSKYAFGPEALRQELNLRYVIETRPKNTLIIAYLEDFK